MTEIAAIYLFGRWGTSVFSENTAIFFRLKIFQSSDHSLPDTEMPLKMYFSTDYWSEAKIM